MMLRFAISIVLLVNISSVVSAQSTEGNVSFKKQVLITDFLAEGVAVADVDKDGQLDVLAGTYWFKAPNWEKNQLAQPKTYKPTEYSNSFMHFAMDVNKDKWTDFIRVGFPGEPATWYENPRNQVGNWTEHALYSSVGNESPALHDIDGDGQLDLLCNNSKQKKVIWLSPPRKKKDTLWKEYVISSDTLRGTHQYTHGLGFGDINGDGRKDVVYREGWWEAPKNRKQSDWKFHPANLGAECAHMYVRDLDGDGDADVLSSSAHAYGIWWYEQVKDSDSIKWVKHEIFKEFSQTHGLMMADMNGDGNEDFVTGKRYYAHNGHDPGAEEPAVLYWFEFVPGKDPNWIAHKIDDNSGAGLNFVITDMNKDKLPDIVISNKKGVYVFLQERK